MQVACDGLGDTSGMGVWRGCGLLDISGRERGRGVLSRDLL